ncbi:MAG: HipA domain-containing protein [Synergistaceae bacterium]|nr:HipA domain-containing protein [Synergistaceae bacterium]
MPEYIFYDKIVVATIKDGKIIFDSAGIEKSGMPSSWKPHIERHLLNALPEGVRFDSLAVLASRNGDGAEVDRPIELVPWVDDLPGRFSAGNTSVYPDDGGFRHYVPFPELIAEGRVQSRLSAAWLHHQSEIRTKTKPSFSGYQDKFVAKLSVENGQPVLSIPMPNERGNVIVKPGNPDYPYIAENEYTCMKLAQRLGLNVPRIFLFRQPDAASEAERHRQHFLIERFDYAADSEGNPRKLSTTEIASLMDLSSETKYDTTTDELFSTAQSNLGMEDMRIFARMYFLGVLVGNGDMHAKNFSLILDPEDGSYHPAPLYDCVCTSIYGFNDILALSLRGTNRPKFAAIIDFMALFLPVEEMRGMALGVKYNLDSAAELAFDSDNHSMQTARERLKGAITQRTASILKMIGA